MGQKVNPHGFRLGITTDFTSRWFADSAKTGQRYRDLKSPNQCNNQPHNGFPSNTSTTQRASLLSPSALSRQREGGTQSGGSTNTCSVGNTTASSVATSTERCG